MKNILYLDDYINLYSKSLDEIIVIKPYQDTLKSGKIVNRKKFIKMFNKIKEEYNLNKSLFSEPIKIIINSNYNVEDKILLKETLEELNYKNVIFINELSLVKLDKSVLFINFNNSYFYIYYVNDLGNIKMLLYENNVINKGLIENILKLLTFKKTIVTGKNVEEIIHILKNRQYNYLYYEDNNNLFIKLILKDV